MSAPKIFNIPASAPFAETLARGLVERSGTDPLALADTVIYLPTRRAARNFGNSFARVLGGAALLPQFRAVGDTQDDDSFFDTGDLPPAIGEMRRQLLLTVLIQHWDKAHRHGGLSFAQAARLADSLAAVMDEIETQGIDPETLKNLAPDFLAEHWQHVAQFLSLMQDEWPAILAAEGRMNPAARRTLAIRALAQSLRENPPTGLVVAAGSTGSIPATADLLHAIAHLPKGAVVLPGIDRELDDKSWHDLDPGHPQFGMKQLLERFGIARTEVTDWIPPARPEREYLLRETLRPAPTTDAWRAINETGRDRIAKGLAGLSVLHAADPQREALCIALTLRKSLDAPTQTSALVTPDRNLARRVAAEMRRWNIEIDDSSGRPLSHAAAGSFLCLLIEAAAAQFAPVPLLALLKHPFSLAGQSAGAFRHQARLLDRLVLRGPAPDPGLDGIARAIIRASQNPRREKTKAELDGMTEWWGWVANLLHPLEESLARTDVALDEMLDIHAAAAMELARDENGTIVLTRSEDGEAAEQFIAELREAATALPSIEAASYPALFRSLAAKQTVRVARSRHPRLAILGPLESRLQNFDLVIVGGLNEGTWPATANGDPWFSRPIRETLGLEQPERAIGLAAHDFAFLASQPKVLLTRAQKSEGAPTIPSRWLQRLMQLTRGLDLESLLTSDDDHATYAEFLTEPAQVSAIAAPAPTPPVIVRPRRLSVTEIETWLRDPYAIYARHILKLRPLDELEEEIGPLERGNAVHRVLELFVEKYNNALPGNAIAELIAIADKVFAEAGIPKSVLAIWRPRFISAAPWFVEFERTRRARIAQSHLEVKGYRKFPGAGGEFTLTCRADRIDRLDSGGGAIIDYKTGEPPSVKQVRELLAPQLPLEGAILDAGGFADVGALAPEELAYLRFSGGQKPGEIRLIPDSRQLSEKSVEQLIQRIAAFDREETPYRSRVRPWRADVAGDYDHLARVREWSLTGWAEDE